MTRSSTPRRACTRHRLARDHAELRALLPSIRLLGGGCGTSHAHVSEIVAAWLDD